MHNYLEEQTQKESRLTKHAVYEKKHYLGYLRYLLFKMILKDIVFTSYAHDNTISAANESIDHSILSLQESSKNF